MTTPGEPPNCGRMISLPRWAWTAFAAAFSGLLLLSFSLGVRVGSSAGPQVVRWAMAGSTYAAAILAAWFVILTRKARKRDAP